jgi:hypothetical protein
MAKAAQPMAVGDRRRLETRVIRTSGRREIGIEALRAVLVSAGVLLVLIALPCASAGAAESAVAPLAASEYTVSPVCAAPAPHHAACLALRLVPKAPLSVPGTRALVKSDSSTTGRVSAPTLIEFKEPIEGSLTPAELLGAYGLSGTPSPATTQTIALIDAYNDPKAASDLATYDKEFALPPCTEASGCFRKVNQAGNESPLPSSNTEGREPEAGWALEISTDVEVAHGVCQSCHILLVEADSSELSDLEAAEETAVKLLRATEVSNSWGTPECEAGACISEGSAFYDPGVVITAAAGDDGYLDWAAAKSNERGFADYPASLSDVIAVGGTRLLQSHGTWEGETTWNDGGQNKKGEIEGAGAGGSGCSISFLAPPWQLSVTDWESVGCGVHRAVADVSADADPYTGVAVYDSTPVTEEGEEIKGWNVLGGTSVASPIIASVFALAGGAHEVEYPAQTLYENLAASPNSLHDVESGSNGKCSKPFESYYGLSGCTPTEEAANSKCSTPKLICLAGKGYDGPTGVGTPNGIVAFKPVSEEVKRKNEERRHAEEKLHEEERQREEKKKQEEEEAKNRGGGLGGSGSGGSSTTSGNSITGVSIVSPPSGTSGSSSSGTSPTTFGTATIKLSAFALTPTALLALNRARPKVSSVHFVFTLSAAARVRATLAKLVQVHGRNRWELVPGTLTFTATKGRNRRSLTNHRALTPGHYRLTLTPEHGAPHTLKFKID